MMRIFTLLLVTGSAALMAFPQNPPSQKPPAQAPRTADQVLDTKHAATEADSIFATWLLVGSSNEIALAQLAQQKATNPDVKQFAQKLIEDHRQMLLNLRPFEARPAIGGARPVEAGSERSKEVAGQGKAHNDFDHVGLVQELGDQCLESSRRELDQKSGAEFDRCFVGMAIGKHMGTNDMLTVFQRHASSSLKPVLTDSQRIVEMHLADAKELAKRLEGAGSKTTLGDTERDGK